MDTVYLVIGGVVFSYIIIDDIFVLSYIFTLRMMRFKMFLFLNKYCWIRKFLHIVIDLLIAGFYIFKILYYGPNSINLFMATFAATTGPPRTKIL